MSGPEHSSRPLLTFPHPSPLLRGTLEGRYDRFIADVRLEDDRVVRCHCVNPGRMEGLVVPGAPVMVSQVPPESPRKLRFTLEMVALQGAWVGANTAVPNAIARELILARVIRGLSQFDEWRSEKAYGNGSRVDFWLRKGKREHYVEVKNCHLVYPDGRGYFPDSVSARATKHLHELIAVREQGHRASVLFTAQDPSVRALRPSDVHDPTFATAVRTAKEHGVRFFAVRVRPTPEAYVIDRTIPVDTKPYATSRMVRWKSERDATSGWKRRDMRVPTKSSAGRKRPSADSG